jgi:sarcosine oxidase
METFDVIVIGVGAMGAAACLQLAQRGARVLGLEQFAIPHGRGSSHGYSRAIRLAYYEHPDYVPLLRNAWAQWGVLEALSGQTLLHRTGCLYLGRPESDLICGSREAAVAHGLPHEMLDACALGDRYPQFNVPPEYSAIFETLGGVLRPEAAVAAFAEQAMRAGAVLCGHATVAGWTTNGSGVTVETADGTRYSAGSLIVSGGAWSGRLLGDLGVPLTVTRQVVGWTWPRRPDLFGLDRFPTWAIEHETGVHYGFPMLPDNPGFKIALHAPAAETNPDTVERDPQPGDAETFLPAVRRFFPNADGPLLALRVCLYTNSPDGHFIVDRHPAHSNVAVACGFSGHGFKFAPIIGEALADLALGSRTALPIDFLGLSRFGSNRGF